jgi:hypothetical protein
MENQKIREIDRLFQSSFIDLINTNERFKNFVIRFNGNVETCRLIDYDIVLNYIKSKDITLIHKVLRDIKVGEYIRIMATFGKDDDVEKTLNCLNPDLIGLYHKSIDRAKNSLFDLFE